jgi:uncharacterized protein YeaO (DUF488 family)
VVVQLISPCCVWRIAAALTILTREATHLTEVRVGAIQLSRVYDRQSFVAGTAYLVERLWPRGMRRDDLADVIWRKDVAPSSELRKWFGHEPAKWAEFQRRYTRELDANPSAWRPLVEAAEHGDVTLVYSSRDREHNNAVVLRDYLRSRLRRPATTQVGA